MLNAKTVKYTTMVKLLLSRINDLGISYAEHQLQETKISIMNMQKFVSLKYTTRQAGNTEWLVYTVNSAIHYTETYHVGMSR
jgi:hypothetical protein